MACVVNEHIGRFEVTVDDVVRVDVRQAACELRRDEADCGHVHRPPLVRVQVGRERLVGQVLEYHVQILHGLEGVGDARHVWMRARLQALELARAVELPSARALREDVLVEHLERIAHAAVLFAHLEYLALVPLTEDLEQLVVRHESDLLLLLLELEQRLERAALREESVRIHLQLREGYLQCRPEEIARRHAIGGHGRLDDA